MRQFRAAWIAGCLAGIVILALTQGVPAADDSAASDVAAARALFEKNLDAIRKKDRAGYLACYLKAESLARMGPTGLQLGYESHAALSSDDNWPDVIDALDLRLVPIGTGVVFGSYRYRVRYGARELRGASERIFVETPEGWRIAMTSAFPEPEGTPPVPLALTGATLVDGTGSVPVPNAVVVLREGRIECAGTRARCPVPEGIEEIALPGRWITPGLIDAHVHFSQSGWADGRPDFADVRAEHPYEQAMAALREGTGEWFRTYLCSGVTAVFDLGGYPWTLALPPKAEHDLGAPHVIAAGPLLSTLDAAEINLPGERQLLYMTDEPTTRAHVRYLSAAGSSAVKLWWVGNPSRSDEEITPLVAAAADEARMQDLPLIAHATTLDRAKAALRAGATFLVHSVSDQEVDEEFLALARESGAVYCPTLTVAEGYRRLRAAIVAGAAPEASDPLACIDPGTRSKLRLTSQLGPETLGEWALRVPPDRSKTAAANLKKVFEAGIPVAMGTDAGNPLTLHGVSVLYEMIAMQEAGLPPAAVLLAATRGSAAAAGRLDELGTVQRGKIADLLVLRSNPLAGVASFADIEAVVRGGVYRSQQELRAPIE